MGQPVLYFTKGCNQHRLREYIPLLRDGIVNTRSKVKPILVMDKHASHVTCKEELEEHFQVEFQATDSCSFNVSNVHCLDLSNFDADSGNTLELVQVCVSKDSSRRPFESKN